MPTEKYEYRRVPGDYEEEDCWYVEAPDTGTLHGPMQCSEDMIQKMVMGMNVFAGLDTIDIIFTPVRRRKPRVTK